jgi:hypothetical protein
LGEDLHCQAEAHPKLTSISGAPALIEDITSS